MIQVFRAGTTSDTTCSQVHGLGCRWQHLAPVIDASIADFQEKGRKLGSEEHDSASGVMLFDSKDASRQSVCRRKVSAHKELVILVQQLLFLAMKMASHRIAGLRYLG
jgi:hypothetical protein